MKKTIVDKLPNCKKRYSASKDIIVCENGEIYSPHKNKYKKLHTYEHGKVLQVNHKGTAYNVAKEVWQAFTGDITKWSDYVMQKDGNLYNNAIDNLVKVSRSEWYAMNDFKQNKKVRNKLTGEIYPSVSYVARLEKICIGTVRNVLNGYHESSMYPFLREKYEIVK